MTFKMNNTSLRKVGKLEEEDRISRMPDSILCHILSFLSTERAVQTCILSSRWKLVWTTIPNLVFNDRLCYYTSGGTSTNDALTKFENFVDRVLLSNSISINKFSLHCKKLRYLSRFKFWVSLAIMRHVHEIEVNLEVGEEFHERVELPECLYNSGTLEVLKLQSDFVFKSPPFGMCFPRVKKFHVEIHKPNLPDFSIFPVLEDLSIVIYLYYNDWTANINISSQTLKRLSLEVMRDDGFSNEHQVMIKAPNLEHLYIKDQTLVTYVVHGLHSLCYADLQIYYSEDDDEDDPVPEIHADRVLQLLKKLTMLKSLFLSHGTIHALGHAYQNFFPAFPNLSHLKVEIKEYGWRMLPIILDNSPNLESFFFEMEIVNPGDYEYEEAEWIEPQFVPHCLQYNVKKIEFFYLDGDELEPVKYFLKNCKVLNMMIIRCHGSPSNELIKKLLLFPRGSKSCEVKFQAF